MTTFKIPKKQVYKTCPKCNRDYREPADSELCGECWYYQEHPEMAPGVNADRELTRHRR